MTKHLKSFQSAEQTMSPSILITGAYGGMGKATAKALKERGFRVFALDKAVGGEEENIIPIKADITDENRAQM